MSVDRCHGMVSTIIPVYNRDRQLLDAVQSVIEQDYRPIEIIIIDDGSTDESTARTIEEIRRRYTDIVTLERQSNAGPGLARERGRARARGEFIQYLDSDDALLPGKFQAQTEALRKNPEADVAYGITLVRHPDGLLESQPNKETGTFHARMFPRFLLQRWWNTSTPLYRASTLDAVGPWTDLRLEEDWEYDCRIAAHGGTLAYVARPVSEHRIHAGARLSVGERLDPRRLSMRARAHALIWEHAKRAGLPKDHPAEVAIFSRALFLLSRQCAAAGLVEAAVQLLRLAGESGSVSDGSNLDLKVYGWLTGWLGVQRVGRWSVAIDSLREKLRSR